MATRGAFFLLVLLMWTASALISPRIASAQESASGGLSRSYALYEGKIVPTMLPHNESLASRHMGIRRRGTGSPMRDLDATHQKTYKLWRGIHNVFMGWLELPLTVIQDVIRLDPFTGIITGTVNGTSQAVIRTGIGFYEAVTFWYIPAGQNGPMLLPEFVMDPHLD